MIGSLDNMHIETAVTVMFTSPSISSHLNLNSLVLNHAWWIGIKLLIKQAYLMNIRSEISAIQYDVIMCFCPMLGGG